MKIANAHVVSKFERELRSSPPSTAGLTGNNQGTVVTECLEMDMFNTTKRVPDSQALPKELKTSDSSIPLLLYHV